MVGMHIAQQWPSRLVFIPIYQAYQCTYTVTNSNRQDAYHQMNCLMNGSKYWTLIEKKYENQIYKHPEPEYEQGG